MSTTIPKEKHTMKKNLQLVYLGTLLVGYIGFGFASRKVATESSCMDKVRKEQANERFAEAEFIKRLALCKTGK